jgi:hypothetical protein
MDISGMKLPAELGPLIEPFVAIDFRSSIDIEARSERQSDAERSAAIYRVKRTIDR